MYTSLSRAVPLRIWVLRLVSIQHWRATHNPTPVKKQRYSRVLAISTHVSGCVSCPTFHTISNTYFLKLTWLIIRLALIAITSKKKKETKKKENKGIHLKSPINTIRYFSLRIENVLSLLIVRILRDNIRSIKQLQRDKISLTGNIDI